MAPRTPYVSALPHRYKATNWKDSSHEPCPLSLALLLNTSLQAPNRTIAPSKLSKETVSIDRLSTWPKSSNSPKGWSEIAKPLWTFWDWTCHWSEQLPQKIQLLHRTYAAEMLTAVFLVLFRRFASTSVRNDSRLHCCCSKPGITLAESKHLPEMRTYALIKFMFQSSSSPFSYSKSPNTRGDRCKIYS